MKQLTDNQIKKINSHLSKMNESQQDAYLQKLEEAFDLKGILSKFGSANGNLKKAQKQRDTLVKQIDKMIQIIGSNQSVQQEQKQADTQALVTLKQKLMNVNFEVQINEENAQPEEKSTKDEEPKKEA